MTRQTADQDGRRVTPVAPRDGTRLGGTRAAPRSSHAVIRRELAARHPRLARLVTLAHPVERVIPDARPLSHLIVRTIVGQLVSTAAARSIMNTLLAAHGDIDGIIAWAMRTPPDDPPAHSLSRAKRKAIAHWGQHIAEHGDPRDRWGTLAADELVATIMELRGLGRWSAQMIAIFGFGHPEIWPEGDAGVMRAARVVFKGIRQPTLRRLIRGRETYVALCCWALLDKGRLEGFEGKGTARAKSGNGNSKKRERQQQKAGTARAKSRDGNSITAVTATTRKREPRQPPGGRKATRPNRNTVGTSPVR